MTERFNMLAKVASAHLLNEQIERKFGPNFLRSLTAQNIKMLNTYLSHIQGPITKSRENYKKLFMILDTFHDITEGSRSKSSSPGNENNVNSNSLASTGLYNYAKKFYIGKKQFSFSNFVDSDFIPLTNVNRQLFADIKTSEQMKRYLETIQSNPESERTWKMMIKNLVTINATKLVVMEGKFDDVKIEFLKEILILQQLSGNIIVIGNKYSLLSDPQYTLSDLRHIVNKNRLNICIDSVKYSKNNHYSNITGIKGINRDRFAVNVAQLADSANNEAKILTYIDDGTNNRPDIVEYIYGISRATSGLTSYLSTEYEKNGAIYPFSYRALFQCSSKQSNFTFNYFFITTAPYAPGNPIKTKDLTKPTISVNVERKKGKRTIRGTIDYFTDYIFVLITPNAAGNTIYNDYLKHIIINGPYIDDLDNMGAQNGFYGLDKVNPRKKNPTFHVQFDEKTKTIFTNIYRGPSVFEIGELYDTFYKKASQYPKSLNKQTPNIQKKIFNLVTDVKRSQDSAQIEMIKVLNSYMNSNISNQYFLLTQDLLCAANAVIDGINVIIESKGAHYIVFNNTKINGSVPKVTQSNVHNAFSKAHTAVLSPNVKRFLNILSLLPNENSKRILNNAIKIANNTYKNAGANRSSPLNIFANVVLNGSSKLN